MYLGFQEDLRRSLVDLAQRTMRAMQLKRPLNEPEIRRMCRQPGAVAFDRIPMLFPAKDKQTSIHNFARIAAQGVLNPPDLGEQESPAAKAMAVPPVVAEPEILTERQEEILEKTVALVRSGELEANFGVKDIVRLAQRGLLYGYNTIRKDFADEKRSGWDIYLELSQQRLIKEGLLQREDAGRFVTTQVDGKRWTKHDIVEATVASMIKRGIKPDVGQRMLILFSQEDGNPSAQSCVKLFLEDDQKPTIVPLQLAVRDAYNERVAKGVDDSLAMTL